MLISILACSLGFYAINFECSTCKKKYQANVVLNPLVSLFGRLVRRSGENVVTDRLAHELQLSLRMRADGHILVKDSHGIQVISRQHAIALSNN